VIKVAGSYFGREITCWRNLEAANLDELLSGYNQYVSVIGSFGNMWFSRFQPVNNVKLSLFVEFDFVTSVKPSVKKGIQKNTGL
jgi:hypothetical protein